ncbi:hypothetical protein ACLBKU_09120 [Erythrobacter sp. NE805]|uniref:hypothetical protein n=1 Tax=Erythrobacter sp. NE805 TaxID=3389875 RepID=UPI00396B1641
MATRAFKTRTVLITGLAIAAAAPVLAAGEAVLDLGSGSSAAPGGTIEVESFSWGVHNAGTHRCPAAGEKGRWMAPEVISSKGARAASAAPGAPPGAACVAILTAREAATGQATGRRKGWDGCVKGNHIAQANLVHRDLAYRLGGATIEECTADGMVLSFDTVTTERVPRAILTVSGSN